VNAILKVAPAGEMELSVGAWYWNHR